MTHSDTNLFAHNQFVFWWEIAFIISSVIVSLHPECKIVFHTDICLVFRNLLSFVNMNMHVAMNELHSTDVSDGFLEIYSRSFRWIWMSNQWNLILSLLSTAVSVSLLDMRFRFFTQIWIFIDGFWIWCFMQRPSLFDSSQYIFINLHELRYREQILNFIFHFNENYVSCFSLYYR